MKLFVKSKKQTTTQQRRTCLQHHEKALKKSLFRKCTSPASTTSTLWHARLNLHGEWWSHRWTQKPAVKARFSETLPSKKVVFLVIPVGAFCFNNKVVYWSHVSLFKNMSNKLFFAQVKFALQLVFLLHLSLLHLIFCCGFMLPNVYVWSASWQKTMPRRFSASDPRLCRFSRAKKVRSAENAW